MPVEDAKSRDDYEVKARLEHAVQLWKLMPGDVLLCRPSTVLGISETQKLHDQLRANLGTRDITILIVPAKWDLAVASAQDQSRDVIEGLKTMLEEL